MKALVGVPQEPEWHPEGDVDVHTLMVADEARKFIDELEHVRQVTVMLGSIAHDFGSRRRHSFSMADDVPVATTRPG